MIAIAAPGWRGATKAHTAWRRCRFARIDRREPAAKKTAPATRHGAQSPREAGYCACTVSFDRREPSSVRAREWAKSVDDRDRGARLPRTSLSWMFPAQCEREHGAVAPGPLGTRLFLRGEVLAKTQKPRFEVTMTQRGERERERQ